MSVKIMSQVWELDIDHSEMIVLLAMADHADDDGQNCYPSNAYLAWKTGYSDRQVRRVLRTLESTGIITRVAHEEGGRGLATEYRLNPEKGDKKSAFMANKRRTSTTQKGDILSEKADMGVQKGGHSYVPPTISNHQLNIKEPSEDGANEHIVTPDLEDIPPDLSDTTPDFQSIHPGPQGPTEPSRNRQGTVKEPSGDGVGQHDYPEWFQPLVGLKGFKTAHKTHPVRPGGMRGSRRQRGRGGLRLCGLLPGRREGDQRLE
jgi:DNA-binding transcriptional ArsR family regulator